MQRLVHAGYGTAFVALLAAATVVTPALAQAPSPPPPAPPVAHHMHMPSAAQRHAILEAEITGFKASLALTQAQESLWPAFAAALQPPEGAKIPMHRHDEAARSPITDMQHAADRLDHRAARLNDIAKAASPLYASLNDNQKLIFRVMLARTAFAHPPQWQQGWHHHWRG